MSASILEVRGLCIQLDSAAQAQNILDSVSFSLPERAVLGIIGESGSGKSVLSRALVNAIRPPLRIASGEVLYHGRDMLQFTPEEMRRIRGREVGYIGANPGNALDPTLPVGHQIVEKLRAVDRSLSRAAAKARVLDVLNAVRMPSPRKRFDEFPFQFSGGMMQRALIVDALVSNPVFLVADNITQALDVTVAAQILRLLRELQEDFKTSIIFISSSLSTVSEIADDVLVLGHGRVVERQPVRALIASPQHDYTRLLIDKVPNIWRDASEPMVIHGKSTEGSDAILVSRNVFKTYRVRDWNSLFSSRHVQAVRGVSFSVHRGDNFGIVGESGCGKSTLSRLLSCIELPDKGEILFEGRNIARLSKSELFDVRKRFQLLLQDPYNSIPSHLQIGRTISEPLYIHGKLTRREVYDKAISVMDEVGLPAGLFHQLPIGLSAGQRQRVNIARAMVLEPKLLILDETLSALDQVEQAKLLNVFERLQAKHDITYIYISHDLAMVRRVCTRIAVMYLGEVVELANNRTMFFDSGHPYTRALLSAVPVIEERPYSPERYLLEGEPPDPIDIPPGCTFRSRCPFAFERCLTESPPLYQRTEGNLSACHLMDPATSGHSSFFERDQFVQNLESA